MHILTVGWKQCPYRRTHVNNWFLVLEPRWNLILNCCWISPAGGRSCLWPGGWSFADPLPRNGLLPVGHAQPCLPGCLWECAPSKTGSFEKGWAVMTELSPRRAQLLVQSVDIKLEILAHGHSGRCLFGLMSLSFVASNLGFWLSALLTNELSFMIPDSLRESRGHCHGTLMKTSNFFI